MAGLFCNNNYSKHFLIKTNPRTYPTKFSHPTSLSSIRHKCKIGLPIQKWDFDFAIKITAQYFLK